LAGIMAQGHYQQVRIGAEATGWYWFPFFLSNAE